MTLPQLDHRSPSHQRPVVCSVDRGAFEFAAADAQSVSLSGLSLVAPETCPVVCQLEPLAAVTVPLAFPPVRTVGFVFPGAWTDSSPDDALLQHPTPRLSVSAHATKATENECFASTPSCTRIRPPRDVVKLEDRLYYLLQPPLESIFASQTLRFPFHPFKYQLDGIAFLYPRNEAVLADEMGLGKTMQTIVAMRLLAYQGGLRRAILVCPKPLVTNWQRELELWAPELPVHVIEGKQSRRRWLWNTAREGVLLANYETLVRDRDLVTSAEVPFDLAVIDESQRIKNRNSTTNHVVCSIPRLRSWALTGTPLENSAEDLVGIFNFVSPGCLQPQMKISSIRSAVTDYMIRRTKDQVLTDLPPKLYRDATLELTPEQQAAYNLAENEGIVHLNQLQSALTIRHVFELVIRLKQICNFDPSTRASSKLDRLQADLEECAASGRKAIIFSQWVGTLIQLRDALEPYGPLEYHGRIPSRRRDVVIRAFRDDPRHHVLLMSYGAGSVGLNLQFAGYVFLFDRWWNPAVEDQAINRAHRIGATGPVTVTRFLTVGTIEERIHRILEEKRELFHSVFDGSSDARCGLSRDDILGLFDLSFPKHDILEEAA